MANPTGVCRVCGEFGALSFEHVPPLAAGNEQMGIGLNISQYLKENPTAPLRAIRRQKLRKGSGGHYLCESCNNKTGDWYVPAYASWAIQGERHRSALVDTNSLALPFRILPNRVLKQITSIFASTCGEGLFEAHPELRRFVLNRDERRWPDGVRVYCFLVHPECHFSRQSGIASIISPSGSHTLAEFAYRPFGYLLTLGHTASPDAALLDITFFADHGFNDYRELHLPLPTKWTMSYLPADYRSDVEWANANKEDVYPTGGNPDR